MFPTEEGCDIPRLFLIAATTCFKNRVCIMSESDRNAGTKNWNIKCKTFDVSVLCQDKTCCGVFDWAIICITFPISCEAATNYLLCWEDWLARASLHLCCSPLVLSQVQLRLQYFIELPRPCSYCRTFGLKLKITLTVTSSLCLSYILFLCKIWKSQISRRNRRIFDCLANCY